MNPNEINRAYHTISNIMRTINEALDNGWTGTRNEIYNKVLNSSPLCVGLYDYNPLIFNSMFVTQFREIKRNKIKYTFVNEPTRTIKFPSVFTTTTRGGTLETPVYISLLNPTLTAQDMSGAIPIKKHNIQKATDALHIHLTVLKDKFGV